MLEVPETRMGTMKQVAPEPPCYQCLFVKPIQDNWCEPETCEMLDFWMADEAFAWDKYFLKWMADLESKKKREKELSEIF